MSEFKLSDEQAAPFARLGTHLERRPKLKAMIDRGRAGFTRTTCRRGHERTPDNTLIKGDGSRSCRICARESQAALRASTPKAKCPECGVEFWSKENVTRHLRTHRRADRLSPEDGA